MYSINVGTVEQAIQVVKLMAGMEESEFERFIPDKNFDRERCKINFCPDFFSEDEIDKMIRFDFCIVNSDIDRFIKNEFCIFHFNDSRSVCVYKDYKITIMNEPNNKSTLEKELVKNIEFYLEKIANLEIDKKNLELVLERTMIVAKELEINKKNLELYFKMLNRFFEEV